MPIHQKAYVYILLCAGGTLYTGSTRNLEKRINCHRTGKGALLTRGSASIRMLWSEPHSTCESAYKREQQIKGWTKRKKWALINGDFVLLKKL